MWIMTGMLLLVPVILAAIVLIPPYIGMWVSLYWIYKPEDGSEHPIGSFSFDYEPIIHQYFKVYDFWASGGEKAEQMDITLPLLLPPALGALVSLILLYQFVMYIRRLSCVDSID